MPSENFARNHLIRNKEIEKKYLQKNIFLFDKSIKKSLNNILIF